MVEGRGSLWETSQEENVRIDFASYPATPHTPYRERRARRGGGEEIRKGDRGGDGDYLSASAVQLECKESAPVTGWINGRVIESQRKVFKVHTYKTQIFFL